MIGEFFTLTIGFGISFVYSKAMPLPPAKITFIVSQLLKNNTLFGLSKIVLFIFHSNVYTNLRLNLKFGKLHTLPS